ncbi:unnamed protein product [Caenorhabditis sp. 36 PRJEB53466]|nr:unnamed protein product [Caenorhabditis sp. 36 PRJEB53466]
MFGVVIHEELSIKRSLHLNSHLGDKALSTPEEGFSSFRKQVANATRGRLDINFDELKAIAKTGSPELKLLASATAGLLTLMQNERERSARVATITKKRCEEVFLATVASDANSYR